MKTKAFLGASALAAGFIALTGAFAPIQAASLTETGVDCNAAIFDPVYLLCAGAFEGNDVPNNETGAIGEFTDLSNSLGIFGTWTVDTNDKSDAYDNGVFTSNPETTSGTLTFKTAQFGLFGISLKAANSFSLYMFDGGLEGITSINFETIGTALNRQGNEQVLSHASFFAFTPDEPHVQVPEPAATAALGLFALTGMGLLKKKSDASA